MSAPVSMPATCQRALPPRLPRRPLAVALVEVLVSAGAFLVWSLSFRHQLPDPVATHWSTGPVPDGFSSVGHAMVIGVVMSLVFPFVLLAVGIGLRALHQLAPVAAGIGVGIGLLWTLGLWEQRGLADAHQARESAWQIPSGFAAGLVVGLLTWLVVRQGRGPAARPGTLPVDAPTLHAPAGTRLAWTGHTTGGRGVWIVMALAVVPTTVLAVIFLVNGSVGPSIAMLFTTLLLAVVLGCMRCHVSIDQRGVRAVGMGIPWVRVPLEVVEGTEVEQVSPLADYGGWGLRGRLDGSGSSGLITGAGPALRIHRAGRGDCIITIEDAERAAVVLNTLVARRAGVAADPA